MKKVLSPEIIILRLSFALFLWCAAKAENNATCDCCDEAASCEFLWPDDCPDLAEPALTAPIAVCLDDNADDGYYYACCTASCAARWPSDCPDLAEPVLVIRANSNSPMSYSPSPTTRTTAPAATTTPDAESASFLCCDSSCATRWPEDCPDQAEAWGRRQQPDPASTAAPTKAPAATTTSAAAGAIGLSTFAALSCALLAATTAADLFGSYQEQHVG